jgi:hypothetical protein
MPEMAARTFRFSTPERKIPLASSLLQEAQIKIIEKLKNWADKRPMAMKKTIAYYLLLRNTCKNQPAKTHTLVRVFTLNTSGGHW